jgi:hypothetical protein
MTGFSRVARRLLIFAWRKLLPQVAVSAAATALGSILIANVLPERAAPTSPRIFVEQPAPLAVPLAQLWPRQADPTRLFALSLDVAQAAAPIAAPPGFPVGGADSKSQMTAGAAPARAGAPKPRRAVAMAADVLPPPRPASLTVVAEAVPSVEPPAESPRLFGVKLPGGLARVGGTVVTTVASLGERLWDQLP